MDYVYICRSGMNEELRYSIRSVVENAPVGNIWVIGNRPNWYNGNFIAVKDTGGKFENIRNCLSVISETNDISNDFVLMHDDVFIIKKIKEIPVYHGGYLKDKVEQYKRLVPSSYYTKLLVKTLNYLQYQGYENPINYEIHVPMTMNKHKLSPIVKKLHLERSTYGNIFSVGGIEIKDVKVYESGQLFSRSFDYLNNESEFVSSTDISFNILYKDLLKKMFTKASQYEN